MNTYLDLPQRTNKSRSFGINSIHDVKLTTGELRNILEDHSQYMDVAKLGVGTALVVPKLKEKIELYQQHDVEVYFGGTLFEKFYHQNRLDDYKRLLNDFNVNLLEVSCGTIDLTIEERIRIIEDFKKDFNVLSEVGSKDSEAVMAPSTWQIGRVHV